VTDDNTLVGKINRLSAEADHFAATQPVVGRECDQHLHFGALK
jgi:hypothetical protein